MIEAQYQTSLKNNTLRQAQLVMLHSLKIIDDICRKNNIEYWLDGGTLLGAVRHSGFIPWDDDIDIGMLRTDFEKFKEIATIELPEDLFLQFEKTDANFFSIIVPLKIRDNKSYAVEQFEKGDEPYNMGLFVDVFAYDHLPENKYKRDFYKYLGKKILKFKRYKIERFRNHNRVLIYKFLDKFISINILDNWMQKIIKKQNRVNQTIIGFGIDSILTRVYKKKEFFPLIELEFENYKFFAPKNFDYYLKTTYGDYMKIPDIDDRPQHMTKILINKEENE